MIYALLVMTSFNQNRRLAPTIDLYMNSKHNAHKTKVYNYIICNDATSLDHRSNYF